MRHSIISTLKEHPQGTGIQQLQRIHVQARASGGWMWSMRERHSETETVCHAAHKKAMYPYRLRVVCVRVHNTAGSDVPQFYGGVIGTTGKQVPVRAVPRKG
jgi:hypothetical protein